MNIYVLYDFFNLDLLFDTHKILCLNPIVVASQNFVNCGHFYIFIFNKKLRLTNKPTLFILDF